MTHKTVWSAGTVDRIVNTRLTRLYNVISFFQQKCVSVCQLHSSDSHGHPAEPRAAGHSVGHLRVHHEEISLLPLQPESLAELHPTQPVSQQLLHQGMQKPTGKCQFNKMF